MDLRVLFCAEAVTLAHVGRSVTLALAARRLGMQVAVACDKRYRWVVAAEGLRWKSLETISSRQFENAMALGTPIYGVADLLAYAAEEEGLLQEFQPDVVVGDFRLSLAASARRQKIPCINVVNAYWSPWSQRPSQVPDVPAKRWLGLHVAQRVFTWRYPHASRAHAQPIVEAYGHLGFKGGALDLQAAYCQGDVLAHPDIPQLFPHIARRCFLGPVHWQPRLPCPDWMRGWDAGVRPLVYVSLGSSGAVECLPKVVHALMRLDVQIVAVTAGRGAWRPRSLPENVRLVDYAPGDEVVRRSSLVVCNGGSLGCHQALMHGVPVLAIPANLDQCLNAAVLESTGAVRVVRTGAGFARRVELVARELIDDPRWRNAARQIAFLAQSEGLDERLQVLLETAHSGVCRRAMQ